ncbi:MAG: fibronectin type III domain-containing protein [Verrucomicrobia bacterium]|nr:fibronectin type III domain-containing protein [Verrucomicrobiota bacterium]
MRLIAPVCCRTIFGVMMVTMVLLSLQPLLAAQATQDIIISWDRNPATNVAGYRVRYGTSSGRYTYSSDVGNNTNATLPNVNTGQRYFFIVTSYDAAGTESLPSKELSFVAGANAGPGQGEPPGVNFLVTSANGTRLTAPASITLSVSASGHDSPITRIEFYNEDTKLGESSVSSCAFTWSGIAAGTYHFAARAFDQKGSSTTTAPVIVVVSDR